eukprot:COSAG01_NODE_2089_length_8454_cov_12.054339_14_plen_66_part_00
MAMCALLLESSPSRRAPSISPAGTPTPAARWRRVPTVVSPVPSVRSRGRFCGHGQQETGFPLLAS